MALSHNYGITDFPIPSPRGATDGDVIVTSGGQYILAPGGGGSGSPGGSSGDIQYNNAGSFGGYTIIPLGNGGTGIANTRTDISTTGTINNQAVGSVWLNFIGSSSVTLTGLVAQTDAAEVIITNNLSDTSANLTLANASASSTAANRFAFPSNVAVRTGQSVRLRYNSSQSRWNLVGQAYSVSSPLSQTGTILSILQASAGQGGYISATDFGNLAFINNANNFSVLQNLNAGEHIEQTVDALTSNPSNNTFNNEGGCDGNAFLMGDVLEIRVRSIKIIAGVDYGSINTSNSYTHTFSANACVDAQFDADDYATVSGYVIEQNLNGAGWEISNTAGVITPSAGTINYHLENNGGAALFPTSFSQSFDAGNVYDSGTNTFYSAVASGPIKASTIVLDDALPVSAGGTGQNDGTLRSGSLSIDWYNRTIDSTAGIVLDYQNALLYGGGGNIVIDLPNHQLLNNSGSLKFDFNLGWIYIGGVPRLFMNNIPSFAAGVTTDVCLKLLPSGAGYAADLLQFRNNNDSANLASFNNLGKLVSCASTTAGASINIPSGTAPTSPVDGDLWETSNHLFARINGVTYQLDQQTGTGVTSVTGTANRITSSGGTTPAIDISASYVGQSSITTLGTIATGVWQGTVVDVAHGGTGASTLLGAGIVSVIGTVSLTNRSADIAAANLATVAGLYRVSYSLQDTAADVTAGIVTLTLSYTDGAGATTNTATQTLTGTGRNSGSVYIQLASGNLTYATTHTGIFGASKYALYITTERLN